MSMKKKLFLHVGPHKTGSTYIQKSLFNCRYKLKKEGGIYYPEGGIGPQWGHHKIAEFAQQGNVDELIVFFDTLYHSGLKVVLSSENFDRLKLKEIQNLSSILEKFDVYIVYVKRRSETLLFSSWQECVKHGAVIGWSEYFLRHIIRPFNSNVFNFLNVFNDYVNYFGREKIIIIDYEAALAENNIFEIFMSCIGEEKKYRPINDKQINKSIPIVLIELIRQLHIRNLCGEKMTSISLTLNFLNKYKKIGFKKKVNDIISVIENNLVDLSLSDSFIFNLIDNQFYKDNCKCYANKPSILSSVGKTKMPNGHWYYSVELAKKIDEIYFLVMECQSKGHY